MLTLIYLSCKLSFPFFWTLTGPTGHSPGPSHIVPILVGDAELAKQASDSLLTDHAIYVQSINYPTVAVGEERLRITPTPGHSVEQLDHLVRAVNEVFDKLGIQRLSAWRLAGGRAGVGIQGQDPVLPVWNDQQLGLTSGNAPTMLKKGARGIIDATAARHAEHRLAHLLGSALATGANATTNQQNGHGFNSQFAPSALRPISVGG